MKKSAEKKEFFLLGAGASKYAGSPDSNELTTRILGCFNKNLIQHRYADFFSRILFDIVQEMKGTSTPLGGDDKTVNIEDVINLLDLLDNRDSTSFSAFMSWDENRLATIDQPFFADKDKTPYKDRNGNYSKPYKEIKSLIHNKVADILWLTNKESKKLQYLKELVNYATRKSLCIATLNYDVNLELAALALDKKFHYIGMKFQDTDSDSESLRWHLKLLKLHGSVNWVNSKEEVALPLVKDVITGKKHLKQLETDTYKHSMIFGGANKLTAKSPYLQLISNFYLKLHEAKSINIIGYSFQDTHVNEILKQWFYNQRNSWDKQSKEPLIRFINPNLDLEANIREYFNVKEWDSIIEYQAEYAQDAIPLLTNS